MALHFLHVGKTGGTAITGVLRHQLGVTETPWGPLVIKPADTKNIRWVNPLDHVFFCVRDPASRFASAFYSRLNKGQPRYYFEWSDEERAIFTRWPTPQSLLDSLGSDDTAERADAEFAMGRIRHVHRMSERIGRLADFQERQDHIVYIGRQETLANDWQQLRRLLELPDDAQLPTDPVRAHRGSTKDNRHFDDRQMATLREWYAEDYAIVAWAEQLRQEHGWGQPVPDAPPALAPPQALTPVAPPGPLSRQKLLAFKRHKVPPVTIWTELLNETGCERVAEIGVFRGKFAQEILVTVPSITTYYLLGPADHDSDQFDPDSRRANFEQAIARTDFHSDRRVLLDGPLEKGLEQIPDGSVDFFHFGHDADVSLRGMTLWLHRAWPKVRDGGWLAGNEFAAWFFRRGLDLEPALTYPYAVHFAELMNCRIFSLPHRQFLIEKDPSAGFEFIDVVGRYHRPKLQPQIQALLQHVAREEARQATEAERLRKQELLRRHVTLRAAVRVRRSVRRAARRVRRGAGSGGGS